jgi:GDP-L-fucose synthase
VEIWAAVPEARFLYVDDLADALVYSDDALLRHEELVNIGTGTDVTIRELAELIQQVVGFKGALRLIPQARWTPRKLLDVSKLTALGWTAKTPLEQGLAQT